MILSTAIIFALIASISAAPAPAPINNPPLLVTIQLANDVTGLNVAKQIPADRSAQMVRDTFADTAIDTKNPSGQSEFLVSSAQLTQFPQGVSCFMADGNDRFGFLTTENTFVDLDCDLGSLGLQNLVNTIIRCNVSMN
ncbi:uncharacterized protein BDZ99DRAFT_517122 [Mytilinidion resinicola]|uniref:Uncharacterized protein n=1 Tax=Mytilinidion resinicola TaxID=574789 RepID=A0A6A6YV51_9PEZI|nr:uncharacterized protein BDZ99DRAFT_517122 [Mytilinidion resinicola]KAF2812812.1 hypothetical protein BDZ99DRAFT_517122 [Mytilinidion resinicola]